MSLLGSGLPEEIDDAEPLARFVFSSRHVAKQAARVKGPAFLPARDGQASISRIGEISEEQIWALGNIAKGDRPETLHGRATIGAGVVRSNNLQVKADEPPPRHGVIVKWPDDKDAQMERAQSLADNSSWVPNPGP